MLERVKDILNEGYKARRADDLDRAEALFAEAAGICEEQDIHVELIQALKGQAQIKRDRNQGALALPYLERATERARGYDDDRLLAHTLRHLADLNQDLGNFEIAQVQYEEALAGYRRVQTTALELANAIRPYAQLMENLANPDAVQLWQEAKSLYATAGIQEGVTECNQALERFT